MTIKEALKQWILSNSEEERNVAYMTVAGKKYTLDQIYDEVENETEFGQDIECKMINLTVNLLLRGKKEL